MGLIDYQIRINDALCLLSVRTSAMKAAILEGELLHGVGPPQAMVRTDSGDLVFRAGDGMAVISRLEPAKGKSDS